MYHAIVVLCVGNFLIGGFFSVYADLLVTIMAQAAVELINTGQDWEPDFHSMYRTTHTRTHTHTHASSPDSGRTLDMQLYYLQSTDIQETLDAYASVKAQNEVKTALKKL